MAANMNGNSTFTLFVLFLFSSLRFAAALDGKYHYRTLVGSFEVESESSSSQSHGRSLSTLPTSTLSQADRNTVLSLHNTNRAKLYTGNALVYNNTLANFAQEWVDLLIKNGACGPANTKGEFGSTITARPKNPYGENVFYGVYSGSKNPFNATFALNSWLAQRSNLRRFTKCNKRAKACFMCKPNTFCDNYVVMMWKKVQQVGCGARVCSVPDPKSSLPTSLSLFVCEYAPKPTTGTLPW